MEREQIEEIKRHFGVVAEALRDDIRQVAEGHSVIRHEMQEFRNEVREEFREVRSVLRLSFSQLDQRIATLESELTDLKARVERLESGRV
jgi:predicted RNase H-like nuclease (RuvC/YqgF family)